MAALEDARRLTIRPVCFTRDAYVHLLLARSSRLAGWRQKGSLHRTSIESTGMPSCRRDNARSTQLPESSQLKQSSCPTGQQLHNGRHSNRLHSGAPIEFYTLAKTERSQ